MTQCLGQLDLSEENLFRVGLLLKALYKDDLQDELDPSAFEEENPAEMNMTFFLYIIKDVLEYVGFLGDSGGKNAQRVAFRELRTALSKFEMLTLKS